MGRAYFAPLLHSFQPSHHEQVRELFAPDRLPRAVDLTGHIATVYDLWLSRRQGRPMPLRSAIDPVDLRLSLPFIALWDVARPGPHITCRLAGTEICYRAGRELRGLSLAGMLGDKGERVLHEYVAVATTGKAHFVERCMSWFDGPPRYYRRLVLPLGGPTGEIDFLLACIDFEDGPFMPSKLN